MRSLTLLSVFALLALQGAAADHDDCFGCACPTYSKTFVVGDASVHEGGDEGTAGSLRVDVSDMYVVEDWLFVNHVGFGFSLWWYQESNGVLGLQRGDDACWDTPQGMTPDTILNS